MSIKRMTAVWEQSQHKGSELLLLLAIADNANDGGYAWPGVKYLASKVRLSVRSVLRLTQALEASGELYAVHNRRIGNKYVVRTGMSNEDIKASLRAHFSYTDEEITNILLYNTCVSSDVTTCHIRSDIAMSKEPSGNVKEPSITDSDPDEKEERVEGKEAEFEGEAELERFFGPRPERHPSGDNGRNYADPVSAGGADAPAEVIVDGICRYNGLTTGIDALPQRKRTSWMRHVAEMLEQWGGATVDQVRLAWQAWIVEYSWKSKVNPFYDSFDTEFGPLLAAVHAGDITPESLVQEAGEPDQPTTIKVTQW